MSRTLASGDVSPGLLLCFRHFITALGVFHACLAIGAVATAFMPSVQHCAVLSLCFCQQLAACVSCASRAV